MTEREEKRLNELLAKKEEEEKAEKEFFSKCRKRKKEVLKALGIKEDPATEKLKEIAEKYSCSVEDLLEYISSEQQINFYKRYH